MAKLIDLTGQKFDKLTVIEKAPSHSRHVYWKCKCDCGNECDVNGTNLRRNLTKSCGCINSSIGELNIETILKENKINFKREYSDFSLNRARFDFAILNSDNIVIRLIEFDGEQHYNEKRGRWQNHEPLETI